MAEQEREAAQPRLQCAVCMEAERDTLFVPCNHVVELLYFQFSPARFIQECAPGEGDLSRRLYIPGGCVEAAPFILPSGECAYKAMGTL